MREVDLLVFLVVLIHREVDDPGELEPFLVDQVQLLAELGAREPCELPEFVGIAGDEERRIAILQAKRGTNRGRPLRADVVGQRPRTLAAPAPHDVSEARLAFALRPRIHPCAERAAAAARAGNGPDLIFRVFQHPREHLEAGTPEVLGDVLHQNRIAQIGLVGAVLPQGFGERDSRPVPGHRLALRELLEHAGNDRLDGRENIVLLDKTHLEIELVELTGQPIGTRVLVAETRRDLEVTIEAGHHQELLVLLRRLRQRVELAGMIARRHQEVARPFRGGRGQDRRLVFQEPLLNHTAAHRGDDLAAQDHVLVQLLAPQIDKAVFEADVLGEFLVAGDLHGQDFRGRLHGQIDDAQFDFPGGQARVDRAGFAHHHLAGDGDHTFGPDRVGGGERRGAGGEHALGNAVMVPQVDEQQAAVVALGVNPAGKTRLIAGVGGAQGATGMGAIGVHLLSLSRRFVNGGTQALGGRRCQGQERCASTSPCD
ncbi:hypothetical protein GALL_495560 [mine drainage metagenome]|uniref:Uncharacterized protein n=1 Tax=mine drainage metagenome TaxID=410659 RepID=A0A1J5PBX2_9ZZZZ